eukprot:TRINITY_DN10122_c0_g1_i1.p1 TRINITY_DN10122_c0_g1~~TRINITY_DN10122_c0_g1_i1.p1  ORF type:complete len:409 (+),score=60.65 TRINITY_DN10122_c0_g1_i1:21-1247(+)
MKRTCSYSNPRTLKKRRVFPQPQHRKIKSGMFVNFALNDRGMIYLWGEALKLITVPDSPFHAPLEFSSYFHCYLVNGDGVLSCYPLNPTPEMFFEDHHVAEINGITSVSEGTNHVLVLDSFGTLYSWGKGATGVLGHGNEEPCDTPQSIKSLKDITMVDTCFSHSLALDKFGKVYAWGSNTHGKLGIGDPDTLISSVPRQIPLNETIVEVAVGIHHSLALSSSGLVYSWGSNANGRLGTNSRKLWKPHVIYSLKNILQLSAGGGFSLALDSDGYVYSWGINNCGQLGLGHRIDTVIPTRIPSLSEISQISCGLHHGIALRSDGTVFAWGGSRCTSSDNDIDDVLLPKKVEGINLALRWHPDLYMSYDKKTRNMIKTLLLLSVREGSNFDKLPKDIIHIIIDLLVSTVD